MARLGPRLRESRLPAEEFTTEHTTRAGNLPRQPLPRAGARGMGVDSQRGEWVVREQLSNSFSQRRSEEVDL